jgi:hypothetical protein
MTPTAEIEQEFYALMGALREGLISEEQRTRLDGLLGQYEWLQEAYVDYMLLWQALNSYQPLSQEERFGVVEKLVQSGRSRVDPATIERAARHQLERFLSEQEEMRKQQRRREPRYSLDLAGAGSRIGQWLTSLYRLTVAGAIVAAIVLTAVVVVQYTRTKPVVATLLDSMNAMWDVEVQDGAALYPGQMKLERGYVHIAFESGAGVWIEAPAEFRLRSDQRMVLKSGRLFAEVPLSAKGFTVETPYAKIVDLGTEFGVVTDAGRTTDVHMFKGKASLVPGTGARAGKGQTLIRGQARSVDNTATVKDIRIQENGFVRRFSAQTGFTWRGQAIDLADVVGGGNGFGTGQLNRWLEISTGLDGTRYIVNGQMTKPYQTTDNRYHRVRHLPYVDGVFSPDGSAGAVQVSSQNHLWQDCPKTAGTYFEDIFNGDYISVGASSHGFVLGGQAFGTREHPAIAVHSNAGITFDLEALRRDMPGLEITGFKATCGVSEDVKKHPEDAQQGKSDFWVLVDGQKRFEAIGMDVNSKPQEISVSLGGQEQFLTFVSTDGDERPNCDWCFFAEPRLEVRVVQ